MNTGLIVQMRLDSSRLPGKALLPLGSTTLAAQVLQRLHRIPANEYILACDHASRDKLAAIAASAGFKLFAGAKEDVLGRFCTCLREYEIDTVIRATGDNPFVSVLLAEQLQEYARVNGLDYAGYVGMPVGMGVEVVRAEALLRADQETRSIYDREHVCPYLYNNRHLFRVEQPVCTTSLYYPDGRLTVDTAEDYLKAQRIIAALGEQPDDDRLIAWLLQESVQP
ncbi:MAG: NTP transferase domain-containing protein [Spirochaetes bacterium]|nr:NTP transferase domain-containing protein [Spirochaetota bacterium]